MVTKALSEQSSRGNDFNNAAHLRYCQYDTETCQQGGQLDVHLKMASQVVHPRIFCKHTPCIAPCRHIEDQRHHIFYFWQRWQMSCLRKANMTCRAVIWTTHPHTNRHARVRTHTVCCGDMTTDVYKKFVWRL